MSSANLASSSVAPFLIGHRGACGYFPEHTLQSYFLAIEQGADFVEPDLVMTKDGVLVARHENEIGATTDVSTRDEFAARHCSKRVDGREVSGWFTEDFTLAELKTLRARERLPALRAQNTRFDNQLEIPTFEEILALVKAVNDLREKAAQKLGTAPPPDVGVFPETKHPSYFEALGLAQEKPLLQAMKDYGYRGAEAALFIQSFEVGNLKRLDRLTRIRLVQLIEERGAPWDFVQSNDVRTYEDMLTPEGLQEIATYASAIGVPRSLVLQPQADGPPVMSSVVHDAHVAGLGVHVYTFRAENYFLPLPLRSSENPGERGRIEEELRLYVRAGVDALFVDHPDIARAVLGPRRRRGA